MYHASVIKIATAVDASQNPKNNNVVDGFLLSLSPIRVLFSVKKVS